MFYAENINLQLFPCIALSGLTTLLITFILSERISHEANSFFSSSLKLISAPGWGPGVALMSKLLFTGSMHLHSKLIFIHFFLRINFYPG